VALPTTAQARFVVFQLAEEDLAQKILEPGTNGLALTTLDLAQAVAANPTWRGKSPIAVVFRPEPVATVGIVGYFDQSNVQLDAVGWQFSSLLSRLHYVTYPQAEAAAERLAATLLKTPGIDALKSARFTAIPRGGYIVLGMLSYLLDLGKEQILPTNSTPEPGTPLVLVDDCALTGFRFGEYLQQFPDSPIVFAHLYSHPALRRAILEREPRVIACVSAHDLHDYAPTHSGKKYETWLSTTEARAGKARYWIGLPDHICFPWSEPDAGIWNPHTERVEHGWRILPPSRCLKNRPLTGPEPVQIQIQPTGKHPLKPSSLALFGMLEEELILGNIESGNSLSLQGVAKDIWQTLVEHGNVDEVVAVLTQVYEVDEARLRADVESFVGEMLSAGLLEYSDGGAA
jgi:hypothetical protein